MNSKINSYYQDLLPREIKSNYAQDINGIDMHYLESGKKTSDSKLIILLHGFPELSYSWRKILPVLSDNGFHVIAPDQRGFGSTKNSDLTYTNNLFNYSQLNLVSDIYNLIKKGI